MNFQFSSFKKCFFKFLFVIITSYNVQCWAPILVESYTCCYLHAMIARSPEQLKKRIEDEDLEAMKAAEEEKLSKIKIDEETVGVTEHKGSKWESNWKNFKEQNPLVQSKTIS